MNAPKSVLVYVRPMNFIWDGDGDVAVSIEDGEVCVNGEPYTPEEFAEWGFLPEDGQNPDHVAAIEAIGHRFIDKDRLPRITGTIPAWPLPLPGEASGPTPIP